MGKHKRILLLFVALVAVYTAFSLLTPTDPGILTRFGLSESQARFLKLTVVLPYAAIWLSAFLGYATLKHYTNIIGNSKDGRSFTAIADGLLVLAIGLPVSAILSSILSYVGRSYASLNPAFTIASNYIDIIFGVIAFSLIYKGVRGLVGIVKVEHRPAREYLYMAAFVVLGVSFIFQTLGNPARQFPSEATGQAAYYLADPLIVLTIILPYLFTWFLGFSSAYGLLVYRKNVKGILYRSGLSYLAGGIAMVIISRIVLRYLASLASLINSASLRLLLLLIYFLVLLIAAGFVLIMVGTRRLKKIEEA